MNRPPTLTSGRQYSHSTGSAATARALATSNCSRQILRAASSARSSQTRHLSDPARHRRSVKSPRACPSAPSASVPGQACRFFATMPGNPAPVPTSTSLPLTSGCAANSRLSAKWRSSMPSGAGDGGQVDLFVIADQQLGVPVQQVQLCAGQGMFHVEHLACNLFLSIIASPWLPLGGSCRPQAADEGRLYVAARLRVKSDILGLIRPRAGASGTFSLAGEGILFISASAAQYSAAPGRSAIHPVSARPAPACAALIFVSFSRDSSVIVSIGA